MLFSPPVIFRQKRRKETCFSMKNIDWLCLQVTPLNGCGSTRLCLNEHIKMNFFWFCHKLDSAIGCPACFCYDILIFRGGGQWQVRKGFTTKWGSGLTNGCAWADSLFFGFSLFNCATQITVNGQVLK